MLIVIDERHPEVWSIAPSMFYVCESAGSRPLQFLAGPYETEPEATAAAGAIEADSPEFRARTFVWRCGGAAAELVAPARDPGTADTMPIH